MSTLQYIKSCFQWESVQRSLLAFLVSSRTTQAGTASASASLPLCFPSELPQSRTSLYVNSPCEALNRCVVGPGRKDAADADLSLSWRRAGSQRRRRDRVYFCSHFPDNSLTRRPICAGFDLDPIMQTRVQLKGSSEIRRLLRSGLCPTQVFKRVVRTEAEAEGRPLLEFRAERLADLSDSLSVLSHRSGSMGTAKQRVAH